jgi:2OG-Fe(II) oxygenase superfamily
VPSSERRRPSEKTDKPMTNDVDALADTFENSAKPNGRSHGPETPRKRKISSEVSLSTEETLPMAESTPEHQRRPSEETLSSSPLSDAPTEFENQQPEVEIEPLQVIPLSPDWQKLKKRKSKADMRQPIPVSSEQIAPQVQVPKLHQTKDHGTEDAPMEQYLYEGGGVRCGRQDDVFSNETTSKEIANPIQPQVSEPDSLIQPPKAATPSSTSTADTAERTIAEFLEQQPNDTSEAKQSLRKRRKIDSEEEEFEPGKSTRAPKSRAPVGLGSPQTPKTLVVRLPRKTQVKSKTFPPTGHVKKPAKMSQPALPPTPTSLQASQASPETTQGITPSLVAFENGQEDSFVLVPDDDISDVDKTPRKPATARKPGKKADKSPSPGTKFNPFVLLTSEPEGKVTNPDLIKLAHEIYNRSHIPDQDKSDPISLPMVWSEGRQGLCETLPYYKSMQGSVYSLEGYIRGMMFDNESHHRDYLDTEVCMTRAAGGYEKGPDGKMRLKKDQDPQQQKKAIENNMATEQPAAVIVGNRNPASQSKPPAVYNVLDFYHFTDIWWEKDPRGYALMRFRLQISRFKKDAWYLPNNHDGDFLLGTLPEPFKKLCPHCNKWQEQVFIQGWMCLNKEECGNWWKFTNSEEPENEADLRYDPRFLFKKKSFKNASPPFSLIPERQDIDHDLVFGGAQSEGASKGVWCHHCGRCSIREEWVEWKCGNEFCPGQITFPHKPFPASVLRSRDFPRTGGYAISRDKFADKTKESKDRINLMEWHSFFSHGHRIEVVKLPSDEEVETGYVVHLISNDEINAQADIGPDRMFALFQERETTDFLRRRRKPNGQLQGESHSAFYSANFGEHYKFVIDTATTSFENGPRSVRMARTRLNWGARLAHHILRKKLNVPDSICPEFTDFNEVLMLGYMEADKIDWHDDGEPGLGGTVGTLSIGADATMEIRYHKKNFSGRTDQTGLYVNTPPIPGQMHYEKRKQHFEENAARIAAARAANPSARKVSPEWQSADNGQHDPQPVQELRKKIVTELGLTKKSGPSILKLKARHGDMIFMVGRNTQEYFEVCLHHSTVL